MVQGKLVLAPHKCIRMWKVNIYKENSGGGDNNDDDDNDNDAGDGGVGDGDFEGNFRDIKLNLRVMT
jgi:hypothetical protein